MSAFFSVFPVILTNLGSFLCFILPMKHRPDFRKRLSLILLLGVGFYGLLYHFNSWFSLPVLLISQLGIVLGSLFLVEGSLFSKLYLSIWTAMVQAFLLELWRVVRAFVLPPVLKRAEGTFGEFGTLLPGFLYLFFAAALLLLVYRFFSSKMPMDGSYKVGPRQTLSSVLILFLFDIMLYHSPLFGAEYRIDRSGMLSVLSEFYCLTFLYLQFALFRESAIEKELVTMELLWKQQKEQYELSKENIALINRKTHDLKHQVRALRGMEDSAEREKYLDEIDNSIQIYESIVKTGSEVLDIILTEKSLLCKEKGIEIHCVADGSQLKFMDAVDIYAVFGNILDNAIEEVQQFEKKEERQIDVLIYVQQCFLLINISNPLRKQLEFEDDLPRTTKGDNGYHGFGLRSVQHTIKKYGGNMTISTENGVFSAKILLPLPE